MTPLQTDSLEGLFREALMDEIIANKNPYLTQKSLLNRILKRIQLMCNIQPLSPGVTDNFFQHHEYIYGEYESKKHTFTLEEQNGNERVLAKDAPHPNELLKFASCWIKYYPNVACEWFAVDGILGNCPKLYVREAFNPRYERHTQAIRELYPHLLSPDRMKEVMQCVFARIIPNYPLPGNTPPNQSELEEFVNFYISEVGEDTIVQLYNDREWNTMKRKRVIEKYRKGKKIPRLSLDKLHKK